MPTEDMLGSSAAATTLPPVTPVMPRPAREDDHRIAAACAAGDTVAFEDLYRRFRDPFKSRSEEHTSELQSPHPPVCRPLLEKKKSPPPLPPRSPPAPAPPPDRPPPPPAPLPPP